MRKVEFGRRRAWTRFGLSVSGIGLLLVSPVFAEEGAPPPPEGEAQVQEDAPAAAPESESSSNGGCVMCGTCEEEEEEDTCRFLESCFDDACGGNCLTDNGFILNGWLSQGYTYNGQDPDNNVNGPVTFNDRANEYQMNQLYLIMGKTIDTSAETWDLGGQVDLLYGTDYYFTTSRGLELETDGQHQWNNQEGPNRAFGPDTGSMYGLAMPQAYAEIGGYDYSIKVGHFYTLIGYEVVTAPGNFFYSHAYTMQYGEPFTHTGVLATKSISDYLSVSGGVTNGWDNFEDVNDAQSFLGGVTLKNEDETATLTFAITTGNENTFTDITGNGDLVRSRENRTMYSIVYVRNFTEDWTYVLQHDNGIQQDEGSLNGEDAHWYGVNQYLFYQLTDNVKAGVRGEWFRDDDGFRVLNGDANYYEVTAGLNWSLTDCLLLRPEARWDWTSDDVLAYDNFQDDDQFLLATDLIWTY